MHNIYAMGGTAKSISQLANTLAEKGHPVTIISVFRGKDPYFKLQKISKIQVLVDYRLKPTHFNAILKSYQKYTPC